MDRTTRVVFGRTAVVSTALGAAMWLASSPAAAADATVGVGATTTVPPAQAAPPPPPPPAPAPAAGPAAPGVSEQEMWTGHLAVGWYGVPTLPLGVADQAAPGGGSINVPVIGARYWATPM